MNSAALLELQLNAHCTKVIGEQKRMRNKRWITRIKILVLLELKSSHLCAVLAALFQNECGETRIITKRNGENHQSQSDTVLPGQSEPLLVECGGEGIVENSVGFFVVVMFCVPLPKCLLQVSFSNRMVH